MTERDHLQNLEREIADRVGKAMEAFRDRIGDLFKEAHESATTRLREVAAELPESFLDVASLEAVATPKGADFDDLLTIVRAIDGARSQAAVLTALVRGSLLFGNRAAFFLIRDGQVRGWGWQARGGDMQALGEVLFPASGSWSAIAGGAGMTRLAEAECEAVASHLDGLTADEAVLVPFVLRDVLAGALYVDGADAQVAALQILAFTAAQAVEILPLRKRASTATLAGPAAAAEAVAEPVEEEAPAQEVDAPEAVAEPEEEAELGEASDVETEAAPEVEPESEAATEEPIEFAEEPAPEFVEADVEVAEETAEVEAEDFETEDFEYEETTAEVVTEDFTQTEEAAEEAPIEDVGGGGWTLEDSAGEDLAAAETAPVPTRPELAEEEEVAEPAESTWAEPTAAEEAPPSTEVAPPAPEPPMMPTGEETVLIRPPAMTEPAPEPPVPEPAPEPMPSTEVTPPADFELPASTEVAPPPEQPAVETPLVTPPSDLEGPGRAFATSRVPIDAEQVQAHEEARRLARLLVSEIKLYNEEEVEEGRRTGDVYARLKEDIDRSRQMFEERIDAEVKESTDYFYQELVRILGGGDADALGM